MIRLTFIIPYYNGIKYIDECILSIYNQSSQKDEYEVIIVNDNSFDVSSIEKLHDYQQQYENLRVIHNTSNQRCGICRNIGVQKARGEYIWFIDQDDYIKPNCIQYLLNQCIEKKLDILYFDYRNVSDDLSYNKKINLIKTDTEVMTGLEYIHTICKSDFWHSEYDTNVWHAIFRKDFMLNNAIFSPPISYCEDMIVTLKAIILSQRFQAIAADYYYYRYNPNSVFHTQVGKNGRLIFDASIYAGRELIKLSTLMEGDYATEKQYVFEGGLFRINSYTKSILKRSLKQRKLFFEYVKNNQNIIADIWTHLTPLNQWILEHPNICKYFPLLVYIVAKLK